MIKYILYFESISKQIKSILIAYFDKSILRRFFVRSHTNHTYKEYRTKKRFIFVYNLSIINLNFLKQCTHCNISKQNVKLCFSNQISMMKILCRRFHGPNNSRVLGNICLLIRMGKFSRLFPTSFRFVTAEIFMSKLAERVCPTHTPNADSASSLSIHIDSLTSAPFCITVHRPGRLPIMSLHSYKAVCHKFSLNRSSLNFVMINVSGEKSTNPT